jgi:hypothetical protein
LTIEAGLAIKKDDVIFGFGDGEEKGVNMCHSVVRRIRYVVQVRCICKTSGAVTAELLEDKEDERTRPRMCGEK